MKIPEVRQTRVSTIRDQKDLKLNLETQQGRQTRPKKRDKVKVKETRSKANETKEKEGSTSSTIEFRETGSKTIKIKKNER